MPSNRRYTPADLIRRHVERGATVSTDGLPSYSELNKNYVHHVIDHATGFVRGHVRRNNIEGFWSVFKRTIKGT